MASEQALIVGYLLDGKGSGTSITDWQQINNWKPEQGCLWIHLLFTSHMAQEWLHKQSGLNPIIVKALTASESRPRCLTTEDGLFMSLRGINFNPGSDPEDMVSIRIWIDEHRIISARKRRVASVEDICKDLTKNIGPKNPHEFLVKINDRLTSRMAEIVETLEEKVDDLEDLAQTEPSFLLRPKIIEVRRQAIMLKRYLTPQREALFRLLTESFNWQELEAQAQLREITDRAIRFVEDTDLTRERTAMLLEELSSRLSEQINQRMYLLSVVAALFLPLSFVTGLLGMNVAGIPGVKSPYSFTLVCVSLGLLSVLMLWIFKRRKWM